MMARKSPAFSFYPDSWIGGTMRMIPEQRAAYIDLMANQWLEGPFSLETALVVCRGCSEKSVAAVLDTKFVCSGGLYYNERLEEERKKQIQFAEKQAKNGGKGGRPRGSKKNPNETQTKAKQNPNESQTITQTETQNITQKKPSVSVSVSDSVSDTSSNSNSTFGVEQHQQFKIVFDSGEVKVGISQGELDLWEFTYPDIDVPKELQRAWAKMMTTDMRRSNESTIRRYFNNWLSKSKRQDSSAIKEVAF